MPLSLAMMGREVEVDIQLLCVGVSGAMQVFDDFCMTHEVPGLRFIQAIVEHQKPALLLATASPALPPLLELRVQQVLIKASACCSRRL